MHYSLIWDWGCFVLAYLVGVIGIRREHDNKQLQREKRWELRNENCILQLMLWYHKYLCLCYVCKTPTGHALMYGNLYEYPARMSFSFIGKECMTTNKCAKWNKVRDKE